jgi:hypothetical protein
MRWAQPLARGLSSGRNVGGCARQLEMNVAVPTDADYSQVLSPLISLSLSKRIKE